MNNKFESHLEDRTNWDYEHPENREPVKSARVVVSVAFRREDFEAVAKYAERTGKKVSEFIREAALDRATGQSSTTSIQGFGNMGTLWSGDSLPSTTLVTLEIERGIHEPVFTSS